MLPEAGAHPSEGIPPGDVSHSAGVPAIAVVETEAADIAANSDMVVQSHPNPHAEAEARLPRPALTVVMQEGERNALTTIVS